VRHISRRGVVRNLNDDEFDVEGDRRLLYPSQDRVPCFLTCKGDYSTPYLVSGFTLEEREFETQTIFVSALVCTAELLRCSGNAATTGTIACHGVNPVMIVVEFIGILGGDEKR
jgi:hypothetical protein